MLSKAFVVFSALLIILLAVISYAFVTADRTFPGAVRFQLPARCELIYFDTSLQYVHTLALACPRKDMIRIWPLPFQNPWFEDSTIPPGKKEGADEISPFDLQFTHLGLVW